jgi:hypothetical protein
MIPRTNELTAMMVDYALILLPLIGKHEAGDMMARQNVPISVAARVLEGRQRPTVLPEVSWKS